MEACLETVAHVVMGEDITLLNIFPEEVWLIIVNHVVSVEPEQAYQFYHRTFPLLQKLLRPNLNKIIFPSVLKILYDWRKKQNKRNNLENAYLMMFPFRQICKNWRSDVDLFLKRGLYSTSFYNENHYGNEDPVFRYMYKFGDLESLQSFQQHFDATHLPSKANPFVTRAVKFHSTLRNVFPGDLEAYLGECIAFLAKYGDHLYNCFMELKISSEVRSETWIRQALALMPNTKTLRLHIQYAPARHPNRNIFRVNPVRCIPKLEKLEFLRIEFLHESITRELLMQNGHVPKVELILHNERDTLEYFHSIQELSISLKTISLNYPLPSANYPRFQWGQLRKLELDLRRSIVTLDLMFYFLEYHFADGLQELRLFFPDSTIQENMPFGRLNLHNLQVLKLHLPERRYIPTKLCCLQFILPTKRSLRELAVWRELGWERDLDNEKWFQLENQYPIEFFSCRHELRKSNLWTMFPLLETLAYICTGKAKSICTRRQWSDYKPT